MTYSSLSTRLGSLGRTSQALAAVAGSLDCPAFDERYTRFVALLERSRADLHAELTRPLPEFGVIPAEPVDTTRTEAA